jgi:hypothetical protein
MNLINRSCLGNKMIIYQLNGVASNAWATVYTSIGIDAHLVWINFQSVQIETIIVSFSGFDVAKLSEK